MKHKVVSHSTGRGMEDGSRTNYSVPGAIGLAAVSLYSCVQAAETAVANKNLELKAGDWHSFSNHSEDISPKEKIILDNYAVSASLLLNPLNEIRLTPLIIGSTSVLQNNAISSDGTTNKVEFALTDVIALDAQGKPGPNNYTVISFRDDSVDPVEGEFDITTRSFIFDSGLPTSATRRETDEHTLVTLRGADLNKQTTPFMTIIMDKLPANANIYEAMKDPEKVREVSIFNPVTGEELVVLQEGQTSSPPTSTPLTPNEQPPSIIDLIGNLIEPSQGVSAQVPTEAPTPTATAEATAIPTPEKVVINGTEAVQKGDSYFITNPVNNREVQVAKIVDGKIVKEEFLDKQLVSCTASKEEILANELGDFADFGGANKIAMLADNEKFPEDVLTGQPIEKKDRVSTTGTKSSVLRWGKEAQLFFDANKEKIPHKIMGCFSRKSTVDGFTYIGIVHKWENPDGTYRYITTYNAEEFFFNHSPDEFVFVVGWAVEGDPKNPSPYRLSIGLGTDPIRNGILDQWFAQQAVPAEAENSAFAAMGPEENYR